MYSALKHIHLLAIAISVTFFIVRFSWQLAGSQMSQKKWVKVSPHIIDTVLLASGISLIVITGFIPFTEGGQWLTEKITCVLAYIALGVVAMRPQAGKLYRVFAFGGALGWVYAAATLALSKSSFLL
ncbi:SirB2 family protein [Veronia pacifica]|uniref:Invasion protein n=1 Tax=Veronia pacifica TaxID=1080227 RepID=A0A1C3EF32_9GAMM|nr:SirB2 family protein [Veronia pacifica]ODA31857.1 invasion protein [Veronia pacifica]